MRIGSLDTISRTNLEGRFVQHDTGTLELSIDSTADVKSDYLNVSGPMLLGGIVVPHTNTLLREEIEFAAADSILLDAKVPTNFLLFDWQLRSKDNKLSIKPTADFTPDSVSLTSNQHSLATYLQRSWDQGEPSDASLFSYFHTFTRGEADNYTAALKQIDGMALNSQPIQMKTSFSTALSESLTCPTLTPEGLKPNQQSCVWARATGDYSTQSSNDRNSGYWVSAPGIRLGGQSDLGNGWTAGMVFGYGTNYLRSDNFSSNGDFFDAAVSARKQLGNWELGGSLAFAQGWFENSRNVQLQARGPAAAMGGEYSSDSSLSMLGLRLRAAYNHQNGVHQFKPYLDVDLSQAWMPAYRESSGDLSLQSKSVSDFNVAITPMLEYTLYSTGKGGSGFKAYLSAGASWLPDNHVSTPMSFRSDQLDNGTFNVVTDGPSLLGRLNVGAEAMISENLEVRAEYNLQMGGGYRNQGISANLRYRF
jgi:outer membrane autotransporter protein